MGSKNQAQFGLDLVLWTHCCCGSSSQLKKLMKWHLWLKLQSLCFPFSTGFVCLGLGAVPLQRGQHDGLPAAERWWSRGGLHDGQVGHGKTAGAQTREWPDGWDHDCKPCTFISYYRALTIRTPALPKASDAHLHAACTFAHNCKRQTSASL